MEGDGDLEQLLLEGLKLLEMDALGGSGSRGYGRVRFDFDDPELKNRFDAISPL
jgi:CRISPR-associated protein Csm3